jgi:hypothetical protein
MTRLVCKAMNLVFDARAIARADAFDDACEHRRAIEPGANDVVRALVRVRDPARHLARMHRSRAHEAEHRFGIVARLNADLRVIDGFAINARWCTRFEAALWQLHFFEPRAEGC